VYSNLHISLIAFLLSLETNYILGIEEDLKGPLLVFFSTLFIYNIGYYRSILFGVTAQRSQADWMARHFSYWIFSILISLLALLYIFSSFSVESQFLIGILSIISFIYIIHGITLFSKKISIRNIPYLKTFIVSAVWAMITTLPQIIDHQLFSYYHPWLFLIIERFLFIFPITLMFDIRDMESDPESLQTIPRRIGIKNSKILAVFSLVLGYYFFYNTGMNTEGLILIAFLYVMMILTVIKSSGSRSELFYSAWFDGMMGLHAIFVIAQFF
jgi:hypothetical protein